MECGASAPPLRSITLTNSRRYRDSPATSAPSTAARSARPGRGNLGPTFVASFATLLFGIAQDVAHQRVAYFGISHIFTHPPFAFDIPQWQ
jgi:hypothetical protein